jgi:hypothetical protein
MYIKKGGVVGVCSVLNRVTNDLFFFLIVGKEER